MEAFLSLNRDASSRVIRFIPFPALGRLAVTSKTINALVTKADINRALERGKALFGKTEVVLQPPYDSFHGEGIGSCVRILDLEENVLEIEAECLPLLRNSLKLVVCLSARDWENGYNL